MPNSNKKIATKSIATKNNSFLQLGLRLKREHLIHYKLKFVKAVGCMVLTGLATAALPFLLQPVFDDVFTKASVSLLITFCGAVLAAFVVKGVSAYFESILMAQIGQGIVADIQKRLFKHLMILDLQFFHNHHSGALLSRFTNDINLMRHSVARTVVGLGRDSVTFILLMALMFYRDFWLACISFILVPAAIIPMINIGKRMRRVTNNSQTQMANFTTLLSQVFQGIRVIKAYNMQNIELQNARAQIDQISALVIKNAQVRALSHPIIETLGGLVIIGVIAYGGYQVMHAQRTTGEFISFIGALILAYEPLKRLSNLNASVQEGLSAAARVFELIDTPSTINNPISPIKIEKCLGAITFENVSFAYTPNKNALNNLNFSIKAGECAAFVGASGAGKSTLINLVPRFYDPNEGRVLIDGVDVSMLDLKYLRSQIALVSQEVVLFDSTVANNISCGLVGAKALDANMEEVVAAAKLAAAHDFIMKLENGYQTVVGENGVKLSGGQRQRLSIARAIFKQAPILLLDEATSALDSESEQQIQGALTNLIKGRTTMVVAHRLSTIMNADIIYVLNNGQIVEIGTHQELLIKDNHYAQLWFKQTNNQMNAQTNKVTS